MPTTLTLTAPAAAAPALGAPARARLAHYASPLEPPRVEEFSDADPAALVEALCDAVSDRSPLPPPAVREVVENLVHAGFEDALVSVLDGGLTVRVSDHGPGIADPERAMAPGFSTAGPEVRALVRGVGGGLPLATGLLARVGGALEIASNLGGGAVVTMRLPGPEPGAPEHGPDAPICSEAAREILALLLEIGGAAPERVGAELGRGRAECGRELALLEHRGLVRRERDGSRRLSDEGMALVATLF